MTKGDEIRQQMRELEERLYRKEISEKIFEKIYHNLEKELKDYKDSTSDFTPQAEYIDMGKGITCRKLVKDTVLAGHYKIVRELGKGGMGIVYQAEDMKFSGRRLVAIKILPEQLHQNQVAMEEFKEEFLMTSQLVHQNICGMYEFREEPVYGTYFLVLEYLSGETLRRLLWKKTKYSFEEALPLIEQITCGLHFAHTKGVLHLDMKPGNVMVSENNEVKLMDFGLARQMNRNLGYVSLAESVGTPLYMSPEQVDPSNVKKRVSVATDIWGMGVSIYEMLSGELPFQGDTEYQLNQGILMGIPEPIEGIPENSWRALATCLAKKPQDRFDNCLEFFKAFSDVGPIITSSSPQILNVEHSPVNPIIENKKNIIKNFDYLPSSTKQQELEKVIPPRQEDISDWHSFIEELDAEVTEGLPLKSKPPSPITSEFYPPPEKSPAEEVIQQEPPQEQVEPTPEDKGEEGWDSFIQDLHSEVDKVKTSFDEIVDEVDREVTAETLQDKEEEKEKRELPRLEHKHPPRRKKKKRSILRMTGIIIVLIVCLGSTHLYFYHNHPPYRATVESTMISLFSRKVEKRIEDLEVLTQLLIQEIQKNPRKLSWCTQQLEKFTDPPPQETEGKMKLKQALAEQKEILKQTVYQTIQEQIKPFWRQENFPQALEHLQQFVQEPALQPIVSKLRKETKQKSLAKAQKVKEYTYKKIEQGRLHEAYELFKLAQKNQLPVAQKMLSKAQKNIVSQYIDFIKKQSKVSFTQVIETLDNFLDRNADQVSPDTDTKILQFIYRRILLFNRHRKYHLSKKAINYCRRFESAKINSYLDQLVKEIEWEREVWVDLCRAIRQKTLQKASHTLTAVDNGKKNQYTGRVISNQKIYHSGKFALYKSRQEHKVFELVQLPVNELLELVQFGSNSRRTSQNRNFHLGLLLLTHKRIPAARKTFAAAKQEKEFQEKLQLLAWQ